MGWGAIIGAVGSIAGGALKAFGGGSSTPSYSKVNLAGVNLSDPNQFLSQYSSQMEEFPWLRQTTQQLNQAGMQDYTSLLNQLYPGLTSQLGQVSSIANSYLKGQIPADVQSQIQRATAQQSLQGGFTGTGMSGALTARDLGLTSMNLQQTGMGIMSQGVNMAKGMIPGYINPAQLMFSPSQLMQRSDQANYFNTQTKNQTALLNAGYAQAAQAAAAAQSSQQASALGGTIQSLFGTSSGGQTALDKAIADFFGGGNSSGDGSVAGAGPGAYNYNPTYDASGNYASVGPGD